MDDLSYTLSNSTVTVAGIPEILARYSEISLGYIDMKAFDPSDNYTFNVELPTGFTNVDHLQTVEVVFDETNLAEGMFTINNFTIKNRPSNYEVQVTTTRLTNVRILGDKSIVDSLTSDDIVAEIDLSDRNIQAGQFSVPIKIYMPTKGFVWAVGDYSAIINVKEL
jgi:YbbR domain-containing protein